MGAVAVGLGGIASTLTAIGYMLSLGLDMEKVVSLRPCKKGEVLNAHKFKDISLFRLNPSSTLKKGILYESQLSAKGYKVYLICLNDPWPMVLDAVKFVLKDSEPYLGDAFCAVTPVPKECYASVEAMAAVGPVGKELSILYPGTPPSDPNCVAERLDMAKECYKGTKLPHPDDWEKFKRLVDYVYAKAPGGTIRKLREVMEKAVAPFYVFDANCFFNKCKECEALRMLGPRKYKIKKRVCKGDLGEVLERLKPLG